MSNNVKQQQQQWRASPIDYDRAWETIVKTPELALARRRLAEDELRLLIKIVAASLCAASFSP